MKSVIILSLAISDMDQKTDNIEISYPNFFLARFARRGLNCAKNSRNSASGVLFLPKILQMFQPGSYRGGGVITNTPVINLWDCEE